MVERAVLPAGLLLLAVAWPARPAVAKEHTAGCDNLPVLVTRVRAGLDASNHHRRRGSSLGTYQVLRSTAASVVEDAGKGEQCGALGGTVRFAVDRARRSLSAAEATAELDIGFESALALVAIGRSGQGPALSKVPPIGEAVEWGQDCPDIFPLTLRLEGPTGTLAERVKQVLADLRTRPRCGRVRQLLERARRDELAHVVESIRLDEPDAEPSSGDVLARCPELPLVVERLATAIE